MLKPMYPLMRAATNYFRNSYREMRSVVWPNRSQIVMHTVLVIFFSALIAIFLGSLDILFVFILEKILVK